MIIILEIMMNEHIFFNVKELHTSRMDLDLDNLLIDMNKSQLDLDNSIYDPYHDYLEYMNNYTVKNLTNILGYYNINKNKLVKDEMVQLIILFENEPTNKNIVDQRKRLWKNILELKNNEYFKKFILF
jgi:hypothetical protein